jgi:hypothetical protein
MAGKNKFGLPSQNKNGCKTLLTLFLASFKPETQRLFSFMCLNSYTMQKNNTRRAWWWHLRSFTEVLNVTRDVAKLLRAYSACSFLNLYIILVSVGGYNIAAVKVGI